jgi:16S rRNA processing protein RimM
VTAALSNALATLTRLPEVKKYVYTWTLKKLTIGKVWARNSQIAYVLCIKNLKKDNQTQRMDEINSDWIVIGQFGRVHGIQGMIRLHSFTQEAEKILSYTAWHRFENHAWIPTERLSEQIVNQAILVKIKGFETREAAMKLTNLKIAAPKTLLPTLGKDEFYCFELVGMEVLNTHGSGGVLGKVVEVLQTGANDVLVIQGEKRHLLPFLLNRVIKQICRETRQITVDWDEDF